MNNIYDERNGDDLTMLYQLKLLLIIEWYEKVVTFDEPVKDWRERWRLKRPVNTRYLIKGISCPAEIRTGHL